RFSDEALGSTLLGLSIAQTVYQWNYSYNEDYLFVVLEITNRSDNDYADFAFGLYCDFDIGGFDPSTGENGRLGDMVAMDTSLNVAWTYDVDGYDRGWGPTVTTGVMGTRYIETPDNIGMTSFRTGQWENVPNHDADRYAYIAAGVFDEPIPPTDQFYLQCTSGINLESGKTIRIGFALIAGHDEADFLAKAQMAQAVYSNHFVGPEPPQPPVLKALVGDGEVRLWWDRSAEASIDPMSQVTDFAGFKIYRSSDRGQSWGRLERHPDGSLGPDYVPLAIWRVDDPTEPIPHTYIDTNLTNGFEWWYSVVAFDRGDTVSGVDPLQTAYGRPDYDVNVITATPRSDPAGYYEIEKTLVHQFSGSGSKSEGNVIPLLFDESLLTGNDYEIGFVETDYYTSWFLLNQTTGDTLVTDQLDQSGDVATTPVADGIRIIVKNGEREPVYTHQIEFGAGGDTTLHMAQFVGPVGDVFGLPRGGDIHFRSTYQLRFTAAGSQGYSFWDDVTPIDLPFEVWNVTTNQQVIAEIYHLDPEEVYFDPRKYDYVVILDFPYDGMPHPEAYPYYDAWIFRFAEDDTAYATGDIFEIGGAPVNGAGDKFLFKVPGVDATLAAEQLDNIRVVPNPYLGRAEWENTQGRRRLEFIHLPEEATVRIYTLAGDLVQTLKHSNSGTLVWDMLSVNDQAIAPGLYFYYVDSPAGQKIGKFAVIK
ncbi:MAG: T9SS type A sorting domain-containing protein, partial [candidate division Zixibacteria bacterium]|nr:T9SS type A sorting domain-containing protein [candidate division Zixibacteria bacterium]